MMINIQDAYRDRNEMILDLFNAGYRQKYIANLCGISDKTVKWIIWNIRKERKTTMGV